MLQINQNEFIPITRNLEDSTDSGTNYVQASIYKFKGNNAGVLLTTLNLTDRGNQKFETAFQAPSDADDYFLEIIIKVFTDSGYTLENARYERTQEKYLVATRWGMMYRGGGGAGVNYDLIKKIVKQEIEKAPKPIQEKIDLSPLLKVLNEVNRNIENIKIPEMPKIPEPEKVDLRPLIKAVENVQQEIKAINIPENDLSPILNGVKTAIMDLFNKINIISEQDKKEFSNKIEEIKNNFKNSTFHIAFPAGEAKLKSEEIPVKKRRIFI